MVEESVDSLNVVGDFTEKGRFGDCLSDRGDNRFSRNLVGLLEIGNLSDSRLPLVFYLRVNARYLL